jgi:hypothetical protein
MAGWSGFILKRLSGDYPDFLRSYGYDPGSFDTAILHPGHRQSCETERWVCECGGRIPDDLESLSFGKRLETKGEGSEKGGTQEVG